MAVKHYPLRYASRNNKRYNKGGTISCTYLAGSGSLLLAVSELVLDVSLEVGLVAEFSPPAAGKYTSRNHLLYIYIS